MVLPNRILLFAPLIAFPMTGAQLVSQAVEGQRVRRTFEIETEMKVVETRQSVDGGKSSAKDHMGNTRESARKEVFTTIDEVIAVDGDLPTEFVRTYEGLKGHHSILEKMDLDSAWGEKDPQYEFESKLKSVLAGESVKFSMNEGAWIKLPVEGSSLSSEQVESLRTDLDLSFLLPERDVKRGAKWEVEAAQLNRLLYAGSNLHFENVDEEKDVLRSSAMLRVPLDPTRGEWKGAITLAHKGGKNLRGRKLILVEIEVDTTMTSVASFDMGTGGGAPPGGGGMPPSEVSTEYVIGRRGKGTLHFDPELGQIVLLDLELKVEELATEAMSMSMPGMGANEIETIEVSEGTFKFNFQASAL